MRYTILCLFIVVIPIGTIVAPNRSVAAPLPIGVLQSPVAAEAGPMSATLVAGGVTVPFMGAGFSGGLVSSVYTNDATNPFGADRLTFTYALSNSSTSVQVLRRLTIAGFADSLVDVSFALFTIEPINRSLFFLPSTTRDYVKASFANRETADIIAFSFGDALGQGGLRRGDHSHTLVVQTNATAFAAASASIMGGSVVDVRSFAPATTEFQPVLEPSTLMLAAGGAVAVEVARRFRRPTQGFSSMQAS